VAQLFGSGGLILWLRHGETEIDPLPFPGPGIDPEHLPHVFNRYWQARRTAHMGTELGLAIAKGIVEPHSGRIWAESQPGQGSMFCVELPPCPE
jgi:signal transduction histidine kinase